MTTSSLSFSALWFSSDPVGWLTYLLTYNVRHETEEWQSPLTDSESDIRMNSQNVYVITFLLLIDNRQTDCLIHKYVDDRALTEIIHSRNDSANM